MLHALEAGLDEHLRAADRLLEIVHAARRGLLHPSLLTSEQIEPIYRDIQDNSPSVVFPISGPKVDIEDLARVATTLIICKNRTLTVWLDIPLLNKADYTLYQLHMVPVTQSILKNGSGRVYIQPKFSHMAMELSQLTYLQMNQQEVDQCEKLRNSYFCPGNLPVYEVSTFKTCESVLLNDSTAESLHK